MNEFIKLTSHIRHLDTSFTIENEYARIVAIRNWYIETTEYNEQMTRVVFSNDDFTYVLQTPDEIMQLIKEAKNT